MRLLDRYLLRHFVLAYVVCFVCLLALYIVVDAFARVDDFLESAEGGGRLAWLMGRYYARRIPWLFQRLDTVLLLLATVFTMAWLEARNELVALRAAGVSTWRILRPLLAVNVLCIGLGVANREFVLPPLCPSLQVQASEMNLERGQRVQGCYDAELVHIEGRVAYPDRQMVQLASITLPSPLLGQLVHMTSREMFYHPDPDPEQFGWVLMAVEPEPPEGSVPGLRRLAPGNYFLRTRITYERLTRSPDWFRYLATVDLSTLLQEEERFPHRGEALALFHHRLTEPLVELLLVVLCMRIVAGPADQRLYLKLGLCLAIYIGGQVLDFMLEHLARQDGIDPLLSAWVPVLLLGPVVFAVLVPLRWQSDARAPAELPVGVILYAQTRLSAQRLTECPPPTASSIAA